MSGEDDTAPAVLVTSGDASGPCAVEELRALFPGLPPVEWIDDPTGRRGGIGMIRPGVSFDAVADAIRQADPVFVRHLAPVQRIVPLRGDETDLATLGAAVSALTGEIDSQRSFAVQTRLLGDEGAFPFGRAGLNRALSESVAARTGAALDCRQPAQVVSVLCTHATGYVGLSRTDQNRSAWPGGERRFRLEPEQVSRAEFKLLEAIEVFGLELPARGSALDIGAAPGGWTRVLRRRGLHVAAVDPSDMDPRLAGDPGIRHIRERIQPYLVRLPRTRRFEVIVNDLKMDAPRSVEILLAARPHLASDGIALLTLKLPKAAPSARALLEFVREDLQRLAQGYRILGARQLFHNRSEVTVALGARR